ncbi:MAG TPA: hypothetical protein VJ802_06890 [Gemmatimonadaceae bacterium]|nr:hypothetical protein [Gemmatimonadaceae bacterium]
MQTWIESIVHSGLPGAFGVLGALVAYAIAARLGLHNGFRFVLAVGGFAALFVVGGGATSRLHSESRPDDTTVADKAVPPLWKYAGFATDTAGAELARFFEDALRELRGDPVVCVNFLYSVVHSRIPPQLSWRLERRFKKLRKRVVEEGQRAADSPGDSSSAVALSKMMVTRLRASHGESRAREILTVMADPANGLAKPREVCDAATAMYAAIADMPPPHGGKLMRHLVDRQAVAPGLWRHIPLR